MNKSTAFRLLSSLTQIGLLDSDAQLGTYRLGLRLLELGHVVQDRLDVRRIALPFLRDLASSTGLTSFICVAHDDDVVCLDRVAGGNVEVLELHPGGRLPLHVGGAGKAILAAMPDERIQSYLTRAQLIPRTERTIVDTQELLDDLHAAQQRGYSQSWEDVTVGTAALGATISNARGDVAGAISVSGLAVIVGGQQHDEIAAALVHTARQVSLQLGSAFPGATRANGGVRPLG